MNKIESTETIIRAWTDPHFRASLSASEQASLPEHPSGAIQLADDELELVEGGRTKKILTLGCCDHPPTEPVHSCPICGIV